jgi:hypothetical protein
MTDMHLTAGRDAGGRFAAGNTGRPRGSRNRVTNRLAMALLDDFAANEGETIERLRRSYFPQYVQLMGRFVAGAAGAARPDFSDYGAAETASVAAAVRAALERVERGEAGLDAVMAALEREPEPEAAAQDAVDYGESTEPEVTETAAPPASQAAVDAAPATVENGESTVVAADETPPPPPAPYYIYDDPTKPFEPGHNGSIKCWPLRRN